MINTKGIKNIILDLGGVILELEVEKTIEAFKKMGFPGLETVDIILSRYPFFLEFETGKISEEDFLKQVIEISGNNISREHVLDGWNAMIQGFREDNIWLLKKLAQNYRLFLLSNTNSIHEVHYNAQLKEQHGINNLDRIFEKVYYSHDLKLRKPDAEIFYYVLKDAEIQAEESLYVDDTLVHIETARELGIMAYHLAPPERLTDIL